MECTDGVDPNDEGKGHIFDLYFNFTICRVVILMKEDYDFDLTEGEFVSWLGYKRNVLKDATNFTGKTLPNITRGVDWVFLHYDLITRT